MSENVLREDIADFVNLSSMDTETIVDEFADDYTK